MHSQLVKSKVDVLVNEKCYLGGGFNSRCHSYEHSAIHGIQTSGKGVLVSTNKRLRALGVGQLEIFKAVGTTILVEGRRNVVLVVEGRVVVRIDRNSILEQFNATRHELMNLMTSSLVSQQKLQFKHHEFPNDKLTWQK